MRVDFPAARITEWYAQAVVGGEQFDSIRWPRVLVRPGKRSPLPQAGESNHYYAARQTDTAALSVEAAGREEFEKFLFYRGVGSFSQPLQARLEGGGIQLRHVEPGAISTGTSRCMS